MAYICRNVEDRTNHPKVRRMEFEEHARNWCKAMSEDFYGVWALCREGEQPAEFWVSGRKYKDHRRACLARS